MENVTLALALLLGLGLLVARLGRLLRLPSVTGYILVGLVLGPTGFNLVAADLVSEKLEHFTQIALMLIAFGIGEHLELRRIRYLLGQLLAVCVGESFFCFLMVAGGTLAANRLLPVFSAEMAGNVLLFSLLLASISIATAPASTLYVIRELKAAGPLTSLLLQVVAMNNGLAIITFGVSLSLARNILGADDGSLSMALIAGIGDIGLSLLLGVVTGLLIEFLVHHLSERGEMLTCGLALLLLCGETARMAGLSPLLAGMAAGFAIVNRDRRDVRLFRIINAFEPPIYVLFFTLAGTHLDKKMLLVAGWLGLAYFFLRAAGKMTGATLGAWLGRAPAVVVRYLGMALLPQAGVAIGLVVLLQGEAGMATMSALLTPVVLAGVFLAEIVGPIAARQALVSAGETAESLVPTGPAGGGEISILPWSWEKLTPPPEQQGVVVFGASQVKTVTGLARIATLLAHRYGARPLAVRVVSPDCGGDTCTVGHHLFTLEERETRDLGYELSTAVIHGEDIAGALLNTARQAGARAIVLGHTEGGTAQDFQKVIGNVVRQAPCPVIVARFCGVLHTERILVPIVRSTELRVVHDLLAALAGVGRHRITLLRLLPSDVGEEGIARAEDRLADWAMRQRLGPYVYSRAMATDARFDAVLQEAVAHDLLLMAAPRTQGVQRIFFGSLALDVAQQCPRPLLMVYPSVSG